MKLDIIENASAIQFSSLTDKELNQIQGGQESCNDKCRNKDCTKGCNKCGCFTTTASLTGDKTTTTDTTADVSVSIL